MVSRSKILVFDPLGDPKEGVRGKGNCSVQLKWSDHRNDLYYR